MATVFLIGGGRGDAPGCASHPTFVAGVYRVARRDGGVAVSVQP